MLSSILWSRHYCDLHFLRDYFFYLDRDFAVAAVMSLRFVKVMCLCRGL